LLFALRGVDENEMLAGAGQDLAISKSAPAAAKVLDDSDVAALFGLEMAEPINSGVPVPAAPKPSRRTKTNKGKTSAPAKAPAQNGDLPRRARSKVGSRRKAKIRVRAKRARRRTDLST
jgi:hypothetical protein